MKQRLLFLLKIYLWFMFMFMLQKPLFMLFHYNLFEKASFIDWMQVIYHGIPLDLSVASYILALPVFVALVTVWIQGLWAEWFYKGYFALIIAVLSLIFISDIELYTYWGFRMDATPLFYLKSPADAMATVAVLDFDFRNYMYHSVFYDFLVSVELLDCEGFWEMEIL